MAQPAEDDWSDVAAAVQKPAVQQLEEPAEIELLEEDIIDVTPSYQQPPSQPATAIPEPVPPPAEVTPEPAAPAAARVTSELAAPAAAEVTPEPAAPAAADAIPEPTAPAAADVVPEPAAPAAAERQLADDLASIEFEEEEGQAGPPSSSRRPKAAAASMDEALVSAAEQIELDEEAELEAPIVTPPPESGRQVAAAPAVAPLEPSPGLEGLVVDESDFVESADSEAPTAPTAEQLGETIDLEEAEGPVIELEEPVELPESERPPDRLEAPLPEPEFPGGYDESLQPPPEAREELARHQLQVSGAPTAEPTPATAPEVPPASAPEAAAAEEPPEVVGRPAPAAAQAPVTFSGQAQAFRPSNFLELLDASLEL
jgi:hypothetical protein